MTIHLIKIQIFTHASRVTKFSYVCVTYVHVRLQSRKLEPSLGQLLC